MERTIGRKKTAGLIWHLALNDFKSRFSTSYLGAIWGFIQPLITILVLWFVFQFGLRSSRVDGIPFIVWYAPAFLSWNFFADSFLGATNSLAEYRYLVRKVNFPVFSIPIVKIISGCFVHLAFFLVIMLLVVINGVPLSLYIFQAFYYFICLCALLLGAGLFCSAITPFFPDTRDIVSVGLQIGFWATPIVWDPSGMSPRVQLLLKINPMYYICTGYRDSFVDQIPFWVRSGTTIYFWSFTLILIIVGVITFRKLRPQFADML